MDEIKGVFRMIKAIKQSILFKLYFVFFRVGLFTIGGGYAMLPMLRKEVVQKYNWATDEEMLDYFAIGQSTPGIIAINTSTFIGYKKAGLLGAFISTLGMVTPSWIIIISIAKFFDAFSENTIVQSAFMGIRVIVVVLILNAVIKMGKKSITNWITALVAIGAFVAIMFFSISAVYVVVASGLIGLLLYTFKIGGVS
jgi:chromate transporter